MPETQLSLASSAAELERLIRAANKFIHSAKAPATLRAYKSDWRNFEAWCSRHRLTPLPATPQTVALYMADSADSVKSGSGRYVRLFSSCVSSSNHRSVPYPSMSSNV
jgi:hypothetical protein